MIHQPGVGVTGRSVAAGGVPTLLTAQQTRPPAESTNMVIVDQLEEEYDLITNRHK